MFFQMNVREGKKFERWGLVSADRTPTREEVMAEIETWDAPSSIAQGRDGGVWVEWTEEILYKGAPRVNHYAALEWEIEVPKAEGGKQKSKKCANSALEQTEFGKQLTLEGMSNE